MRQRTHLPPRRKFHRQSPQRVGLARAISKLGYCSRTQAASLIAAQRVRLNGTLVSNPEAPVRLPQDKIEVDGQPIRAAEKEYWMLNKPRGIVTTASDEKGRATVYDFLDPRDRWLAPVGRLDQASEGLLLLTNDSQWAARILDPAAHVAKTYHVHIAALPDDQLLHSLQRGVRQGAEFLRAANVRELRRGDRNSWLEIVLLEGKNRQIRRMLDALGIEVLRLIRTAIGELQLGDLPKGKSRRLNPAERALVQRTRA